MKLKDLKKGNLFQFAGRFVTFEVTATEKNGLVQAAPFNRTWEPTKTDNWYDGNLTVVALSPRDR